MHKDEVSVQLDDIYSFILNLSWTHTWPHPELNSAHIGIISLVKMHRKSIIHLELILLRFTKGTRFINRV